MVESYPSLEWSSITTSCYHLLFLTWYTKARLGLGQLPPPPPCDVHVPGRIRLNFQGWPHHPQLSSIINVATMTVAP
jgi:hypothetical protein